MKYPLKKKRLQGLPLVGTMVTLPSPELTEILCSAGFDCLFIGPYDLSASMGKMGHVNDPEIRAAIAKVKKCADTADLPTGIFGMSPEAVRPYIEAGFTLIAVNIDTMIFGEAAKKIVAASS